MGLGNYEHRGTYLTIMRGKVVQRVDKDTEGAIERVTKTDKTVYELEYDYISGLLVDIKKEESEEYNDQWVLTILDGGDRYYVRMTAQGGYSFGLFNKLMNIDLSKPVKILPYLIEGDDGKERSFLGVHQNGEKVPNFFTKEEPNGLPDLEQKTVNKKKVWDGSKRWDFLEKMLEQKIRPQFLEAEATEEEDGGPGNEVPISAGGKLDLPVLMHSAKPGTVLRREYCAGELYPISPAIRERISLYEWK